MCSRQPADDSRASQTILISAPEKKTGKNPVEISRKALFRVYFLMKNPVQSFFPDIHGL